MENIVNAGWKRCFSNKDELYYFFNTHTGEFKLSLTAEDLCNAQDWIETKDENGEVIFFNDFKNEVRKPVDNKLRIAGWSINKSKDTGMSYYFNTYTGISKFELTLEDWIDVGCWKEFEGNYINRAFLSYYTLIVITLTNVCHVSP